MKKTPEWIPGTYGLNQPAAVVTADVLVFRRSQRGEIQILVGTRNENSRWEAGKTTLVFGGFVDVGMKDGEPTGDTSTLETVEREVHEEIPGVEVRIFPRPIIVTGPWKYRYTWVPGKGAVNTQELAQEIPVVTISYLGEYVGGEAEENEEIHNQHWISLEQLMSEKKEFAFDHAAILHAAIPIIQELSVERQDYD